MANKRRGEVEAVVGGRRYALRLTLGALAELEDAFGVDDLGALAERFAGGRLSAGDLVKLFGAGLRGAGAPFTDADVAALPVSDGLEEVARAVAALLAETFGTADGAGGSGPGPPRPPGAG